MDPYEALGVTPATPLPEIETAYRLLLRRYHPDLHHADGPTAIADAEAMTRRLTLAMAHVRADHGQGSRPADGDRVRQHRPRDQRSGYGHREQTTSDWTAYSRGTMDGPVPCPYCGQLFDELAQFMGHLRAKHHGPNAAASTVTSRHPKPNRFIDTFGALRFVPNWLVAATVFLGVCIQRSPNVWLVTLLFVLVISWAKTSRRYKHRSHLHHL